MRKILFFATALLSLLSCKEADQWELVWEENFDGPELDASVWSRIRRGTPEWQDTQAPDDFNVYSVDFYPDSMVYHVNGERVFAYFKDYSIPEEKEQFPFYRPMFLMIDMQLRGSWPGPVDPKDLPVEMEVDWVRHYQLKR